MLRADRVRVVARGLVAAACALLGGCAAQTSVNAPMAFPRAAVTRPESPPAPEEAGLAADVVTTALDLRGTPYRLGGDSPQAGFDCSGFVQFVLAAHNVAVPRTTAEQFEVGLPVPADSLRPGDLIFFSTTGPGPTHVGLVVTTGVRPEFVHAPADGSSVRLERLDVAYWSRRMVGARRVLPSRN